MVYVRQTAFLYDVFYIGMRYHDRVSVMAKRRRLIFRGITIIRAICLFYFHTTDNGHTFGHKISSTSAVDIFSLYVTHREIRSAAEHNLERGITELIISFRIFYLACVPHIFQCIVEIAHRESERRAFLLVICVYCLVLHHLY